MLESVWLTRYPRPKDISINNGSKCKVEFSDLCGNLGVMKCPSNAWNPQSNAIVERIHKVLANGLITYNLKDTPIDLEELDPFNQYVSAVSYAIRSSYHQSHRYSQAQLLFRIDMFFPVSTEVDQNAMKKNQQI